jgi:hypothetical protein
VRAQLVCTTCRIVVATGPACEREPLAAFELGRLAGITESILHLGICAGGALDVRLEEVPNPAPAEHEQLQFPELPDPSTFGQPEIRELGRAAGAAERELRIVYDGDDDNQGSRE